MSEKVTCASCGDKKPLCQSVNIEGIQQPRICKECLLNNMQTGEENINDIFWLRQLLELKDTETLNKLCKNKDFTWKKEEQ
ncbi:hypothetical protein A2Z67_03835 [Candidatus Woesebacteria bacterium RBG_13_36_22]|uniref:Uncharacterized protein n=1 Tax=Candidatus Woesebacteria bacterium RBG_13_36_22 TaxID=1802478 RepID=A0A1F7X282_9BACT|nr:MAG: hypothetical protein A2Z67_03835 [Candidatus Woesebacteria bacterium RBG_13_36_22]